MRVINSKITNNLVGTLLAIIPSLVFAQEIINTDTHRLEEVAEGVYFAIGTGDIYTMSNALIIERDDDVTG